MGYRNAVNDIYVALRDLFKQEGIDVEPQVKELE